MRIVDYDPITREGIKVGWDHENDRMLVEHFQDTSLILEDNKLAALDIDSHRKQSKNDWALHARIPNIIAMKWRQEYGVDIFNRDHSKKMMQLLEDPEWKYLKRTTYKHDR